MEQQYTVDGTNLIIASILVLSPGKFLNSKISIFGRFNIPVAVTGGLLFSLAITLLYKGFDLQGDFDLELRSLFLLTFFSTMGLLDKFKLSTLYILITNSRRK